jgi:hypothetical protein
MSDTSPRVIAESLVDLASADMKPGDLFKAARKKHPAASKKDIVRGAFRALIDSAREHPERVRRIHDMAIGKSSTLSGE